ncbi:MAG TPA: hypothetical protein PL065_02755, partial [Polyangiaceae bacterium]|nr:hypothetical protein [Polyangiaceae bacterium]
ILRYLDLTCSDADYSAARGPTADHIPSGTNEAGSDGRAWVPRVAPSVSLDVILFGVALDTSRSWIQ